MRFPVCYCLFFWSEKKKKQNEAEISWSWYSEEGETREIDMYQYDLTELVPSPDANIPFWRERTQGLGLFLSLS